MCLKFCNNLCTGTPTTLHCLPDTLPGLNLALQIPKGTHTQPLSYEAPVANSLCKQLEKRFAIYKASGPQQQFINHNKS